MIGSLRNLFGLALTGHHPEPPSPIQTLWDNLCAYLSIFRKCGALRFARTLCHTVQYLRNIKGVPCFYGVIQTRVEVWENEKCSSSCFSYPCWSFPPWSSPPPPHCSVLRLQSKYWNHQSNFLHLVLIYTTSWLFWCIPCIPMLFWLPSWCWGSGPNA